MTGKRPAALYHRVSTLDQNATNARTVLRRAAAARGFRVELEVEETGSGARNDRPGLQRVIHAAELGQVDAVIVWSIDRFARSALDLETNVERLRAAGVAFIAVSQGIELKSGGDAVSKLLFTMLAGVAEFERTLIRERTRLALERRREKGLPIGRAITAQPPAELVRKLRRKGLSWAAIALELDCHPSAARRAAKGGAHAS